MQTLWRCRISYCLLECSFCLCMLLNYKGHVTGQQHPPVEITPASEYFEEGRPASLSCLFSEPAPGQSGDFPLSWSRVGGLPVSSSINSSRAGTDAMISYQSTLTFAPGALDNQMAITCTATVGNTSWSSSYKPRIILIPDEPIIVSPNRSDASGNLTWTCHSHGASQSAPNVYWRDARGAPLLSGVSSTTTVAQRPNENIVYSIALNITRAAKDFVAANSLVCVVVHSLAEYISKRWTTQVLDLPRVYKNGTDVIYVSEGARLSLSCVVKAGYPPATNITWTRDGQAVTWSSPGRYENVNLTSASLVILSVTKHDMGDYLCTATSLLGTAGFISPTTLIVKYRPQIPSLTNATTVEAPAGASVVLQCPVDSFPRPTRIQWSRVLNGHTHLVNTSSDPRYSGATVANQQYDLAISSLLVSDVGVYMCVATNEVGRGVGPNMTLVVTSPGPLVQHASTDTTTAVVFGVISLVLFVIIIIIIVAACYLCKCSKGHERARVGPVLGPAVKHSGRLFLPSVIPEPGPTSQCVDSSTRLTNSTTPLPPARQDDHHAESDNSGPLPETLETPVFRLPHLDPDTRSYDTPFRMFLPPWNPESGHIPRSDEDSTTLTTSVTLLPPARHGDHHEDGPFSGPLPETMETPVFRLPHLGPETRSCDTPFRMFLPPWNPESGHIPRSDEDSTTLTAPVTLLPPARQGDHHEDGPISGPLPETLETPVFRLPHLDPDTRSYDTPFRMFLPPWNPESGHIPRSDEDSTTLTTSVTLLPPARQGDHHEDGPFSGPLPETLENPVFRLPHLDPATRSYDTPFRWSAHLQNNSQASNGNVFKVSGGQVTTASLDQTLVLREKLSMMK